jgi:hypothetical protein
MRKCVCRLAAITAMALMPMTVMTMPTASSAPCDDGKWWSPHSNACEALPCPYGSLFDANDDVCQCDPGWRYNPLRNMCQSVDLFAPPILHH